jgi:hypothetical protein
LNWFEFEIWFEFDLKSIEKIKRKEIRNSEKVEKWNSSHSAQLSLARPRARSRRLTGGPHLSATARVRARALSLPLSLLLYGGTGLSARPLVRTLSLSPSCCTPFPNLPPALSVVDAPMTRVSRPLPHAPEPFSGARTHSLALLAQLRPQPNTLALSRTMRAHVELHRGSSSVLWPSSNFCRVYCLGELCLLASNARHSLVCPPTPLFHLVHAHRPSSRASGAPPPSTKALVVSTPSFKRP